jgi:polysaccharide biosynthesis protein PslJ
MVTGLGIGLSGGGKRPVGRVWLAAIQRVQALPPRVRALLLAVAAALLGLVAGLVSAAAPLVLFAGIAGMGALYLLLEDTRLGLYAAVLVITLLPFGVIPVALGGFQFTFLDLALTLTLLLWFTHSLLAPDGRLHLSPVAPFVFLYVGITAVALVNGMAYGTTPFENLKLYAKSINGVLLFFTVLNCLRGERDARRLANVVLWGGAVAGALGVMLYLLPHDTTIALLSRLERFGYPSGPGVLHFLAESPRQRATGTSIDPNAYGSMLLIVGALGATQLMAAKPVTRRWLIFLLLLPVLGALLLTLSRSSWAGLAGAIAFAATIRYHRLWLILLPLGLAAILGIVPGTEQYLGHLISGLRAEDKAAAMRLGEYKDAIALISAYPWLGVGYGPSPRIDLYVGVSSIYFLLAEHAGLLGLGAYLAAMAALVAHVLRTIRRSANASMVGLVISALCAVVGALVAGLADHPFINIRFTHLVALFWLTAGLAVAAARFSRAELEPEKGQA